MYTVFFIKAINSLDWNGTLLFSLFLLFQLGLETQAIILIDHLIIVTTLWLMQLVLLKYVLYQCSPPPPIFIVNEIINLFKLFFITWIKNSSLWRTVPRVASARIAGPLIDWPYARHRPEGTGVFHGHFTSGWPCSGQHIFYKIAVAIAAGAIFNVILRFILRMGRDQNQI